MPIAQLAGSENPSNSSKSKTFVFKDEGHTLGNALVCIICSYPDIQFCGYTIPHPAESKMHLRIQMHKGRAVDALRKGLEDLVQLCDLTLEKFDEELQSFSSS